MVEMIPLLVVLGVIASVGWAIWIFTATALIQFSEDEHEENSKLILDLAYRQGLITEDEKHLDLYATTENSRLAYFDLIERVIDGLYQCGMLDNNHVVFNSAPATHKLLGSVAVELRLYIWHSNQKGEYYVN